MRKSSKQTIGWTTFNGGTTVHDEDLISSFSDYSEIVRNQDHSHTLFFY